MNDLKEKWYEDLTEDCKDIVTETIFTSRWALVEGYHKLGERIREDKLAQEFAKGNKGFVQDLARNISISERTVYYAIQFYDKYPSLDKVPEGKNISWNKVITKYLPAREEFEVDIPLPKGKYSVILADPPWDIGSIVLEKWESPLDDKYPTMTMEELKKMDVENLSANDCVCFLWTTLSTLIDALDLLKDWGFKYHITLTWDKGNGWSANGFHRKSELVLVGYKGKLSAVIKQKGEYIPTVFFEAKTTHSTKPKKMYEFIEKRTNGKKIELFARTNRDGWAVWGQEV